MNFFKKKKKSLFSSQTLVNSKTYIQILDTIIGENGFDYTDNNKSYMVNNGIMSNIKFSADQNITEHYKVDKKVGDLVRSFFSKLKFNFIKWEDFYTNIEKYVEKFIKEADGNDNKIIFLTNSFFYNLVKSDTWIFFWFLYVLKQKKKTRFNTYCERIFICTNVEELLLENNSFKDVDFFILDDVTYSGSQLTEYIELFLDSIGDKYFNLSCTIIYCSLGAWNTLSKTFSDNNNKKINFKFGYIELMHNDNFIKVVDSYITRGDPDTVCIRFRGADDDQYFVYSIIDALRVSTNSIVVNGVSLSIFEHKFADSTSLPFHSIMFGPTILDKVLIMFENSTISHCLNKNTCFQRQFLQTLGIEQMFITSRSLINRNFDGIAGVYNISNTDTIIGNAKTIVFTDSMIEKFINMKQYIPFIYREKDPIHPCIKDIENECRLHHRGYNECTHPIYKKIIGDIIKGRRVIKGGNTRNTYVKTSEYEPGKSGRIIYRKGGYKYIRIKNQSTKKFEYKKLK
jgi:hypothetical protein